MGVKLVVQVADVASEDSRLGEAYLTRAEGDEMGAAPSMVWSRAGPSSWPSRWTASAPTEIDLAGRGLQPMSAAREDGLLQRALASAYDGAIGAERAGLGAAR